MASVQSKNTPFSTFLPEYPRKHSIALDPPLETSTSFTYQSYTKYKQTPEYIRLPVKKNKQNTAGLETLTLPPWHPLPRACTSSTSQVCRAVGRQQTPSGGASRYRRIPSPPLCTASHIPRSGHDSRRRQM